MHIKKTVSIIIRLFISLFCCISSISAMVYDNRYFPLLQYPYISVPGRPSHVTGDFFITTASNATDNADRSIGIPELSGPFDQAQLAYSMTLAGFPDPLSPGLLNGQLPWNMYGKLQTQGFAYSYRQKVWCGFSVGILGFAMRSNSSIDFYFNSSKTSGETPILTESDVQALDETRRTMFTTLGLACNHVQQGGLGDTELYLRWYDHWDYSFKLRSLEYAFRLGLLVPTGVKRNINEPASVPFGGNGHWGIYVSGDTEAELKEDWKVGGLLRLSKRFARTRMERLPLDNEPQIFGVITAPVSIDPGLTAIFSAYTQWEGIRDGLGVRLQYTLINHNRDHWIDARLTQIPLVQLEPVERYSGWASEYVTVSAFYDFSRIAGECGIKPIVRGMWDIPFTLLVGHRFVHSYKVSLGLEFNF